MAVPAAALIMLIDDEPINIKVARRYLQEAGYKDFIAVTDSTIAMDEIMAHKPDVIVLDVMMPRINGIELLQTIRSTPQTAHIPGPDPDGQLRARNAPPRSRCRRHRLPREAGRPGRAAAAGPQLADDQGAPRSLNARPKSWKPPFRSGPPSWRLRVWKSCSVSLVRPNSATTTPDATFCASAGMRASSAGRWVSPRTLSHLLELAAQLHDVGKIGIPDSILLKAGSLTPEEFDIVQRHCGFGKRVFESANEQDSTMLRQHSKLGAEMLNCTSSPLIQIAARTALTHHERWDGTGYPLGLAGEDIPIEGRIVAVADVFDALSSRRPYKPAFPLVKCFQILEEGRAKHFDPTVLDAFESARNQIVQIQLEYADVN